MFKKCIFIDAHRRSGRGKSEHSTHIDSTAIRYWLPALLLIFGAALFALVPRIPQPTTYHAFADSRQVFGLINCWNVVSNLPFLLVGTLGLLRRANVASSELLLPYRILCLALLAVAAGSSLYHYAPDNASLVWDRLPISIAFMALFSAVIGDCLLYRQSNTLLAALLTAGIASVLYWHLSESWGAGDMRPYVLVQALPMLLIPLIIWRYPPPQLASGCLWLALIFYLLSKVCEYFDAQIFSITDHWQGGHAIKHLLAAIACLFLLRTFRQKTLSRNQGGT